MALGVTSASPPDAGYARRRIDRLGVASSAICSVLLMVSAVWIRVLRFAGATAATPPMAADASPAIPLAGGSSNPQSATPDRRYKNECPGRLPRASSESTLLPGEPMNTVAQIPVARPAIGPNQLRALVRWHKAQSQFNVLVALSQQPKWPLISTGGTPHVAKRKSRANNPGGGHVA